MDAITTGDVRVDTLDMPLITTLTIYTRLQNQGRVGTNSFIHLSLISQIMTFPSIMMYHHPAVLMTPHLDYVGI